MWHRLRQHLQGHWTRLTDRLNPGVPDTWFCFANGIEGGLELKYVASATTPTGRAARFVPGLRPEQVIWLTERSMVGGRCGVLVQVGQECILLFRGNQARELTTARTLSEWMDIAYRVLPMGGRFSWAELKSAISTL